MDILNSFQDTLNLVSLRINMYIIKLWIGSIPGGYGLCTCMWLGFFTPTIFMYTNFPVDWYYLCLLEIIKIIHFEIVKGCMYTGPLKRYFTTQYFKSCFTFFYINSLYFTLHVLELSCNFISINHVNV